jgi:hypothetical protein
LGFIVCVHGLVVVVRRLSIFFLFFLVFLLHNKSCCGFMPGEPWESVRFVFVLPNPTERQQKGEIIYVGKNPYASHFNLVSIYNSALQRNGKN